MLKLKKNNSGAKRLNTFTVSRYGNCTVSDLGSISEIDVFFPSQSLLNLLCGHNKFIPVGLKTAREVDHSSASASAVVKE